MIVEARLGLSRHQLLMDDARHFEVAISQPIAKLYFERAQALAVADRGDGTRFNGLVRNARNNRIDRMVSCFERREGEKQQRDQDTLSRLHDSKLSLGQVESRAWSERLFLIQNDGDWGAFADEQVELSDILLQHCDPLRRTISVGGVAVGGGVLAVHLDPALALFARLFYPV